MKTKRLAIAIILIGLASILISAFFLIDPLSTLRSSNVDRPDDPCPDIPNSIELLKPLMDRSTFFLPSDIKNDVKLLYAMDPVDRGNAMLRLGSMGEKAEPAIPYMLGLLDDYNEVQYAPFGRITRINEVVVETIGEIHGPCAVKALQIVIKSDYQILHSAAIGALGKTMHVNAFEPLIEATKYADAHYRGLAIDSLEELFLDGLVSSKAEETLINLAIHDLDENNRIRAADVLFRVNSRIGVDIYLEQLQSDKDSTVRFVAAQSLGLSNDSRAIETLISALVDEDQFVQEAALRALRNITKQDFGNELEEWRMWWEENK